MTEAKPVIHITARYGGKTYEYDTTLYIGEKWSLVHALAATEWQYSNGNDGCACNLSRKIGLYADDTFPELDCSEQIEILSVTFGGFPLDVTREGLGDVFP